MFENKLFENSEIIFNIAPNPDGKSERKKERKKERASDQHPAGSTDPLSYKRREQDQNLPDGFSFGIRGPKMLS